MTHLFRIMMLLWTVVLPTQSMAFSQRTLLIAGQRLHVEVAKEEQDLRQGLMFRKSIAPFHGMLFDFGLETNAQMWMKNTLIPLDMVFFDGARKIVHIHYGAVPQSLDIINSPFPARYVLELNAGDIDRLELKIGDVLEFEGEE